MDIYAQFVRHVIAPLWSIKERSPYLHHLKYVEDSQYFSTDELKEVQWKKLKNLLEHAYENVEYYRERFDKLDAVPGDIRSWDDFSMIDLLTKDVIRDNQSSLIAKNVSEKDLISKKTSGSTGVSLEFYVDETSLQWKRACRIRHDRWAGWDIGERVAAIWGNPEHKINWRMKLRNLLLDRHVYLDTLKMDVNQMEVFFNKIRKRPPRIFYGHAHSLYLFAKFLKQKGWQPPQPSGIISTAMILHKHERQLVEQVFNSKIFNRYGCEEVSLIACECEKHTGLHINMDNLIVEVLKDGRPVKKGEPGAIVVTDLSNYVMPFIRYKVGDVGVLAEHPCSCGRGFSLFKSIEGRAADYILTPEGNYISGISLTENFAMKLPEVKQLQIIQDKIDHLILRIVKAELTAKYLISRLNVLVKERFGPSMRYNIEYVDSIEQESSGKYRFCISEIDSPFG